MKVEHFDIFGVIHRRVSLDDMDSAISCGLPYVDATIEEYAALDCESARTDAPLTCVMCLAYVWSLAAHMFSRRSNQ